MTIFIIHVFVSYLEEFATYTEGSVASNTLCVSDTPRFIIFSLTLGINFLQHVTLFAFLRSLVERKKKEISPRHFNFVESNLPFETSSRDIPKTLI